MFIWTDEAIQCVKDLWGKQSAEQIACVIGHHSRNAVCGKAHRLGLSNGHKPAKPRVRAAPFRKPRVQRFREVIPPPDFYDRPTTQEELKAEVLIDDLGQVWPEGISLMELTHETCHWPLWSDANPERLYCGADGADMENKRPYCSHHSRMAYRARAT